MNPLDLNEVKGYIESHIGGFHQSRLESIEKVSLEKVLKRKNPYLFRAKNIRLGSELAKTVLDAHLSSQEEGLFGEFLEGLVIFVADKVYGGRKSPAAGIDMELTIDGIIYIIAIKSGPNWGNSGQIADLRAKFKTAIKILKTNNRTANIIAVNGCCYGRDELFDKGDYWKLCGQRFWRFISASETLYTDIIEPLGHRAKERNDEFQLLYDQAINRFGREILTDYVTNDLVDWDKLVRFVSSQEKLPRKPRKSTQSTKIVEPKGKKKTAKK